MVGAILEERLDWVTTAMGRKCLNYRLTGNNGKGGSRTLLMPLVLNYFRANSGRHDLHWLGRRLRVCLKLKAVISVYLWWLSIYVYGPSIMALSTWLFNHEKHVIIDFINRMAPSVFLRHSLDGNTSGFNCFKYFLVVWKLSIWLHNCHTCSENLCKNSITWQKVLFQIDLWILSSDYELGRLFWKRKCSSHENFQESMVRESLLSDAG